MHDSNQDDWEKDPVWKLVEDAPPAQAGSLFARNVMREVRLSHEKRLRWWHSLLAPIPLAAGGLAAVAAALILVVGSEPSSDEVAEEPSPAVEPAEVQLGELVEEEMLREAANDPSAFTDEDLVTLLY